MSLRFVRTLVVVLAAASILILSYLPSGALAQDPGPNAQNPGAGHGVKSHHAVCPGPAPTGTARCFAHVRDDADALSSAPNPAGGAATPEARGANPDVVGNNGAYDPSYLQSAYNLPCLSATSASCPGAGETVAVVDAYDDPTAASDLAAYRSLFGLPATTLTKVNQTGGSSYPAANSGWAEEISLDLDMISAICPNCHIILVEANSNSFSDLDTAVEYAATRGVVAISNSYGGSEFSAETSTANDQSVYSHPGIAVTASAGDSGYGVEFPAASQYVTAVGGTTLTQTGNAGSRNATETVWSGTGSGCSAYETKPTWQTTDSDCLSHRTNNDAAAVADPNTGVWVQYNGGWYIFGGTSVASPIIASVYALAGNSPSGAKSLYSNSADLFDVTTGSNGTCGTYLCNAADSVGGYNGPTGLGTPNGSAVHQWAGYARLQHLGQPVLADGDRRLRHELYGNGDGAEQFQFSGGSLGNKRLAGRRWGHL